MPFHQAPCSGESRSRTDKAFARLFSKQVQSPICLSHRSGCRNRTYSSTFRGSHDFQYIKPQQVGELGVDPRPSASKAAVQSRYTNPQCAMRELNSHIHFGRVVYCRCTNDAKAEATGIEPVTGLTAAAFEAVSSAVRSASVSLAGWIRTNGLLAPNQARCQTSPQLDKRGRASHCTTPRFRRVPGHEPGSPSASF
jgi:hypothetical protein